MTRIEFYQSKAWQDVRRYIWLKQNCLCAKCHRPVYVDGITQWLPREQRLKGIVHHKIYLTDNNLMDDSIALDENNLEGLCIDCHNEKHFAEGSTRKQYAFDEVGNLIEKPNHR